LITVRNKRQSAKMNAYPEDIRPLTALRFVAAFWVLLYHFRGHFGFDLGAASGIIANGNLGVDLFFILSGFILSHVYLAGVEAGQHRHLPFLWARIARVWPLHLATLLFMIALWFAGQRVGADFDAAAFNPGDIWKHLLMIHAWGTTAQVGWNFPSWSISAEWFAYLTFPVFAFVFSKLSKRPALGLGLAAVLLVGVSEAAQRYYGHGFTDLTAQGGAVRIIPSFALGVALYVLGRGRALGIAWGWPLVVLSLIWVLAVTALRMDPRLAWPGLAGLVFGLAETSKRNEGGFMAGGTAVYLGHISYAMYMIHLPVDVVWGRVAGMLGVTAEQPLESRASAMIAVFALVIAGSVVAYELIERPARDALRKLGKPMFAARPAQASSPQTKEPATEAAGS
jgi:peptidoglycan/LPS O-acetylase OafA/YrhL